jgi:hypothetical protein
MFLKFFAADVLVVYWFCKGGRTIGTCDDRKPPFWSDTIEVMSNSLKGLDATDEF